MRKIEIMTGLCLIAIFCASFHFYFRTNVDAQIAAETDAPALRAQIQTFLEMIEQPGSSSKAYQTLLPSQSPLDPNFLETVQKTDDLKKMGTRWRLEHLSTQHVGNDLILIRYLHKNEKFPVLWHFTFYRPPTAGAWSSETSASRSWNCIGVRFVTNYDSLFSESWPK